MPYSLLISILLIDSKLETLELVRRSFRTPKLGSKRFSLLVVAFNSNWQTINQYLVQNYIRK